jgi:hypothetical protein
MRDQSTPISTAYRQRNGKSFVQQPPENELKNELLNADRDMHREKFKQVEKRQVEFHEWLKSKHKLSEDEKQVVQCKNYEDFSTYWAKLCSSTESSFETSRGRGWKKWSKKYQSFAAGVSRFMQDVSGLVGLVKDLGPPYTNLAVGTISALFVVRNWLSLNSRVTLCTDMSAGGENERGHGRAGCLRALRHQRPAAGLQDVPGDLRRRYRAGE